MVGHKGDPEGLLLHMLRQLRDAGLKVTAANHEFSPGQFEINLGHSELADAADRSFRLKSAVQEIARRRGLLATFMAKPFNDEGGSGFHVHVSLGDDGGANVFGDPDGQWASVCEIGATGALLVRPDQHVAWRARSMPADASAALAAAVRAAFGRL